MATAATAKASIAANPRRRECGWGFTTRVRSSVSRATSLAGCPRTAFNMVMDGSPRYAFPHGPAAESRRLQLLEERLDPITIRRRERLGPTPGASRPEGG